ncbi:protein ARV 2-like isoform X2 [Andrographis paniculata]|uniref:protein ARV 2-like isoform X2 n=1 Tax=Andrographis paniculata TaxID=175694 RepID=UPI0021E7D70D|nr:protein ARV 2-like isoform X2 [Andrographis paniculata]
MEESGRTTSEAEGTTAGFRCVQCGFPIKTLYIQYSPGNIRLMKCGNCKAVADEYIECELMILMIDLILHKPKAYRHLFYNVLGEGRANFESLLGKSILAYLVLEFYRMWALITNEIERPLSLSAVSFVMDFGKVCIQCLLLAARKFLNAPTGFHGWKWILLVVLVSSYFKIFLMAMMVWDFPSSVIYIIDIFVMSSNIVALKVVTDSDMARCLAVCVIAHGIKFLAGHYSAVILQTNDKMLCP